MTHLRRHLPDDRHEGRGVLERRVQSDRQMCEARAPGYEADARPARYLGVRLGGETRALLVTSGHKLYVVSP